MHTLDQLTAQRPTARKTGQVSPPSAHARKDPHEQLLGPP